MKQKSHHTSEEGIQSRKRFAARGGGACKQLQVTLHLLYHHPPSPLSLLAPNSQLQVLHWSLSQILALQSCAMSSLAPQLMILVEGRGREGGWYRLVGAQAATGSRVKTSAQPARPATARPTTGPQNASINQPHVPWPELWVCLGLDVIF